MLRQLGTWLVLHAIVLPVVAGELPLATASRETIADEYRLDGVVEAVHQATVSAQTSGRIIELPYDVNDLVEKGAVIVRFRDTEQRARFERARASLAEVEARFAEADAEFKRIRDIHAQQLVSRAEMDRAQANLDASAARLTAATAALREAEEQLEQTVVRAPYSGMVRERLVELGELATVGMPLMSGISLEQLRVRVDVPQALIDGVREQQAATVLLPDGTRLAAESLRIYPYADERAHTFGMRIELPQGQHGLYPGMLVKVLLPGAAREALLIPHAAVLRRGEVTAAYVQDASGQLQFRQLRIGNTFGERVEVLAGLQAGEQVVVDPVAATIRWKEQAVAQAIPTETE